MNAGPGNIEPPRSKGYLVLSQRELNNTPGLRSLASAIHATGLPTSYRPSYMYVMERLNDVLQVPLKRSGSSLWLE